MIEHLKVRFEGSGALIYTSKVKLSADEMEHEDLLLRRQAMRKFMALRVQLRDTGQHIAMV